MNLKKGLKIGRKAVCVIAVIVNSLTIALLLLSAYGGMIDPRATTIGALAAMAFPLMLAVNALFLLINLFLFRRIAIANGCAFILCLGPFFTYCPVSFNSGVKVSDGDFTLISYNIYDFQYYDGQYDGDSPNLSLSFILQKDADIVCLQEAEHFNPLDLWHFNKQQMDSVLKRYPYRIISPTSGLGIMSKYPVDTIAINRNGLGGSFSADFCCYRLKIEGRELHIFNTHLQSIGLDDDDKKLFRSLTGTSISTDKLNEARHELISKLSAAYRLRAAQADQLRSQIDSIGGNVIVCGDFNDIPGSYSARTVAGEDLIDAFRHAGSGPSITYHASKMLFRIDHIFYSPSLEALKVEREKVNTSDHYPIFAIFKWEPEQGEE